MAKHGMYRSIVDAVTQGRLEEPFSADDFREACSGFAYETYRTFPYKHRVGNPGGYSALFVLVAPGRFKLRRPFRYGFDR
ncbi:MAG: hypothetical protein JRE24_05835 [Deltaproteobacteria bacterium]|jgi:hypothetical protein|nr:hypothetical protein [Deltaproteobacteria bacterium]